jgi:RNA polymerase sigma-70 factor (ECF subfamily)
MPVEMESDAAVMERVQAGELEQFATLIRRYQPALLRVARSRLGDASWAEDVVQETFLAVYKARHTYDPGRNFRTWLWTILINQCRAHGQKRSRWLRIFTRSQSGESETAISDNPPVDSQDVEPLERLMAAERAALLEELLAKLPVAQGDALRLRFFGELKFQEIADATGCSLLTAKNRVRLGLLRLSQLISARGTIAHEQVDGLFIPPTGRNRA